jgi:hypothetical protein
MGTGEAMEPQLGQRARLGRRARERARTAGDDREPRPNRA